MAREHLSRQGFMQGPAASVALSATGKLIPLKS